MARPLSKLTRDLSRRLTLSHLSASLRYRSRRLREAYRNSLARLWHAGLQLTANDTSNGGAADFFRKRVWIANRTYLGKTNIKTEDLNRFEARIIDIASGKDVPQSELLPFLCLEDKEQRAHVNAMLADAYFQQGTSESLVLAGDFMQRAWMLSGFAPDLLDLYVKIFAALENVELIREAYKRLGLEAGKRGDTSEAIRYFDLWHWSYHKYFKLDKYEYDFDILDCMDKLAAPHRVEMPRKRLSQAGEKIRVAYLLRGFLDPNSNLLQISLEFAKHHDRTRFDPIFFAAESRSLILSYPQGADYLEQFEKCGYEVVTPKFNPQIVDTLLQQAQRIRESNPHLLVTSAALADFSHYFMTTLRPSPIVMGLVQGPPAQFAPPVLDWCIAWTRHPLIDCPTNCSWVEIKLDYPSGQVGEPYGRETLGLPDDACVMLSGGRDTKFQNQEFWKAIVELLLQHRNAYYVVCGASEADMPFFNAIVPDVVRSRVRCLGWRQDFLQIVPTADIFLDTYPNGGGQTIVQAMASAIPVVAHRNDFRRLFSQTEWSPVEDFIRDPEMLVERGDFEKFKTIVARLIEDKDYRKDLGERCRQEHLRVADPSQAIRGCEEVYERVVRLLGG